MENCTNLFNHLLEFMPQFISGLLSVIPFFILWMVGKSVFGKVLVKSKGSSKHAAILFVSKSINLVIWSIALLTMLGTWGLDVRALVAGLGLTGFAIGYALKDVLINSIAGIMIIFYKPIEINSRVSILEVEGTVVDIDLRYTTIQDDKATHLIPNARLLSEKVTIFNENGSK